MSPAPRNRFVLVAVLAALTVGLLAPFPGNGLRAAALADPDAVTLSWNDRPGQTAPPLVARIPSDWQGVVAEPRWDPGGGAAVTLTRTVEEPGYRLLLAGHTPARAGNPLPSLPGAVPIRLGIASRLALTADFARFPALGTIELGLATNAAAYRLDCRTTPAAYPVMTGQALGALGGTRMAGAVAGDEWSVCGTGTGPTGDGVLRPLGLPAAHLWTVQWAGRTAAPGATLEIRVVPEP